MNERGCDCNALKIPLKNSTLTRIFGILSKK